jgi:catalase-peroxidase
MAHTESGMRVLGGNAGESKQCVLTSKPGTLSNDFFLHLLDMSTKWQNDKEIFNQTKGHLKLR